MSAGRNKNNKTRTRKEQRVRKRQERIARREYLINLRKQKREKQQYLKGVM